MADLQQLLGSRRVDIVLLQEPYCLKGVTRGLSSNYFLFDGKPADHRGTRASIVVCRSRLDPMQIEELSTDVGVCVLVRCEGVTIFVVSLYCMVVGSRIEEQIEYLNQVLQFVGNSKLLIGMDANAFSPCWHKSGLVTNQPRRKRGDKLVSWMDANSVKFLNRRTTLFTYEGWSGINSDIDVTCAAECWDSFTLRRNLLRNGISDHNILMTTIRKRLEGVEALITDDSVPSAVRTAGVHGHDIFKNYL